MFIWNNLGALLRLKNRNVYAENDIWWCLMVLIMPSSTSRCHFLLSSHWAHSVTMEIFFQRIILILWWWCLICSMFVSRNNLQKPTNDISWFVTMITEAFLTKYIPLQKLFYKNLCDNLDVMHLITMKFCTSTDSTAVGGYANIYGVLIIISEVTWKHNLMIFRNEFGESFVKHTLQSALWSCCSFALNLMLREVERGPCKSCVERIMVIAKWSKEDYYKARYFMRYLHFPAF